MEYRDIEQAITKIRPRFLNIFYIASAMYNITLVARFISIRANEICDSRRHAIQRENEAHLSIAYVGGELIL
jgi:hypothetical protein